MVSPFITGLGTLAAVGLFALLVVFPIISLVYGHPETDTYGIKPGQRFGFIRVLGSVVLMVYAAIAIFAAAYLLIWLVGWFVQNLNVLLF